LHGSAVACYFDDLQQADLIRRGEGGAWLLSRSLDSTDLLRVYQATSYRLPLQPVEEAAALGVELPPSLLAMLVALASSLEAGLGTRLARIYPPTALSADATEEPVA
jgi:membrane protein